MRNKKQGLCSKIALMICLLVVTRASLFSQQKETLTIGFYNLENAFDTLNDGGKQDGEYLPAGRRKWDTPKYQNKLNHIVRVILAANEWEGLDVVGVCEVENKNVLFDIIRHPLMKQYGYRFVHEESPDVRGIDVALLYKKGITYVGHRAIPIQLVGRPTRDILHVTLRPPSKDTLHLLVNHWPSRMGGAAKSEPKRLKASETLVDYIIQSQLNEKHTIVMGDFNDEPDDSSVHQVVAAGFTNLSDGDSCASHKYKAAWAALDQVMVSESLVNTEAKNYSVKKYSVFRTEWLLEKDAQYGGVKPFRSWDGLGYQGGYSDHLPVVLTLSGL